jgi:hypothetical protein
MIPAAQPLNSFLKRSSSLRRALYADIQSAAVSAAEEAAGYHAKESRAFYGREAANADGA